MQEHFKPVFIFCCLLVAAALGISIYILHEFGERYAEQILTYWQYAAGAAGISAVTGIAITNMQKTLRPGTTTADISATITQEEKKEG